MSLNRNLRVILTAVCLVMVVLAQAACQSSSPTATSSAATQAATQNTSYAGKRILYVNSYSVGYAWSDGIEHGVHNILDKTAVELKFVRMDTKNHPDDQFREQAGKAAKAELDAFKPDLVIASDDNAQQWFVIPYLQKGTIPCVFAGVNWDASSYNFDRTHITGIVKVHPIGQLMSDLKPYVKGSRVGYVTIDTETERGNYDQINRRFFNGALKPYIVKTYADFKDAFLKAQAENDGVILGNNAGSSDKWDDTDAIPFFTKNTRVPTGTVNDWMTSYTLITVARIPEELGEWSAQTALRIFDGTPVSSIDITENRKFKLGLNLDIGQQLGIVFTPEMLRNAAIYSKQG
ncbi:MAG TPA: hypothetical protein VMT34_18175 [Aggregatilineales bacterium]|nr:hypothetical protein [Aggregatilineales bacterium]